MMNPKNNDMKKYLTARERDLRAVEPKGLVTELQELIDREVETCEQVDRLQKRLGNYKGAFLLHELTDRKNFLKTLLLQQEQLSIS
jgi:hypothetical protein